MNSKESACGLLALRCGGAQVRSGRSWRVVRAAGCAEAFVGSSVAVSSRSGSIRACVRRPRRQVVQFMADPMGGTSDEKSARSYRLEKTVLPGDTDYSGAVWHPTYLRFFEEARVNWLAKFDLGYHELVESRIELPVVEASLRYKRPARLGDRLNIDIEWQKVAGVRMLIHGEVRNAADNALLVTSTIQLVPVNMDTRRIARNLPESLRRVIGQFNDG